MILKKGEQVISLENENHISAFLSAGYTVAEEKPVEIEAKEEPEKKKIVRGKSSTK